jgi:hypothetical protein
MAQNWHHPPAIVHGGFAGRCLLLSQAVHHRIKEPTMNTRPTPLQANAAYELRFQSLFDEGRAFAFPCDAAGHVDLDALSERARHNYLYARAVIGREVGVPAVRLASLH